MHEDFDRTGGSESAGRTSLIVGFVMRWLICKWAENVPKDLDD